MSTPLYDYMLRHFYRGDLEILRHHEIKKDGAGNSEFWQAVHYILHETPEKLIERIMTNYRIENGVDEHKFTNEV